MHVITYPELKFHPICKNDPKHQWYIQLQNNPPQAQGIFYTEIQATQVFHLCLPISTFQNEGFSSNCSFSQQTDLSTPIEWYGKGRVESVIRGVVITYPSEEDP